MLAECIPIDEINPGPVGVDTEDQQRADQLLPVYGVTMHTMYHISIAQIFGVVNDGS